MPVLATSPHIHKVEAVEMKKKKFKFVSDDGRTYPSKEAVTNFFKHYIAAVDRQLEEDRQKEKKER